MSVCRITRWIRTMHNVLTLSLRFSFQFTSRWLFAEIATAMALLFDLILKSTFTTFFNIFNKCFLSVLSNNYIFLFKFVHSVCSYSYLMYWYWSYKIIKLNFRGIQSLDVWFNVIDAGAIVERLCVCVLSVGSVVCVRAGRGASQWKFPLLRES